MWLGYLLSAYPLRGRADLLPFLALRPWLLVLLAVLVRRWPWRERAVALLGAVALASAGEALLIARLGNPDWLWPSAASVALGGVLAFAIDGALASGRRLGGRGGLIAGGLALLTALVSAPIGLGEVVRSLTAALEPAIAPGPKPRVALLTSLPLVWGEGGMSDALAEHGGGAAWRALSDHLAISPIDAATDVTLAPFRLALIAQPRPPGPAGLVALDEWVRRGGNAVVLVDPSLRWPSRFSLGDPRRPSGDAELQPLLAHWGLALRAPEPGEPLLVTASLTTTAGPRRLSLAAPGRFDVKGGLCRVDADGLAAWCPIGRGEVQLLADADLLADRLWLGPGPSPIQTRVADNPLLIVDWLLAGAARRGAPAGGLVPWIDPVAHPESTALSSGAPALLLPLISIIRRRRKRVIQ